MQQDDGDGDGEDRHVATPSLDHVTPSEWLDVYEPREDTFLLLDALQVERKVIQQQCAASDAPMVLEVGSGSGCVITFVSSLLGMSRATFVATDVNECAARVTRSTFEKNRPAAKGTLEVVVGDLLAGLQTRLRNCVDVMLFNAPYVPTDDDEVGHEDIRAAWAGGDSGMTVTDRLLPLVSPLLRPGGMFYLVAVADNRPADIMRTMSSQYGLKPSCVLIRKASNEKLFILRFRKKRKKNKSPK